jgi:hypothetical protein
MPENNLNIDDYIKSSPTPEIAYRSYKIAKIEAKLPGPTPDETAKIVGASKFKGLSTTSSQGFSSSFGQMTGLNTSSITDLGKISGNFVGGERFGMSEMGKTMGDIVDALEKKGPLNILKLLGTAEQQLVTYLTQETEIRNNINKSMGVTGKLGNDIRDSIMASASTALRFGFSTRDLTESFIKLNEQTGRFNTVSSEILNKSVVTARAFGQSMADIADSYASFEKIGLGFSQTLESLNSIGKRSLELGLSGSKTIKDVKDNLAILNTYGFKNGVEGLAEMSRVATMFRMNMQEAFKVADKVMDPEGAVALSSGLQALGGAIGEFNDPLKLMYDATNNVEGLQKALVGASRDLATYNKEQGRFEITGANIRRAHEMAKLLGVDYNELTKGAVAAQEKIAGLKQIAMSPLANISDEQKDFLLNLAHMEKGEMKITIPPNIREEFNRAAGAVGAKVGEDGFASIQQFSTKQMEFIKRYQDEFKKMSPEDIAKGQFTMMQNIDNNVSSIAAYYRAEFISKSGGALKGMGLGDAATYAINALNLKADNLRTTIQSGEKLSAEAAIWMKKGRDAIIEGAGLGKIKEYFSKAEESQEKELERLKKQNAGTVQPATYTPIGGIASTTLYGSTSTPTNITTTENKNITYKFLPTDNYTTQVLSDVSKNVISQQMLMEMGGNEKAYTNRSQFHNR